MRLDFQRPAADPHVWLDTITVWGRTLAEVPEDRLGDAYEAALDAHDEPNMLVTALEVRAAWRQVRHREAQYRPDGVPPAAIAGLEYRECAGCRALGYAPPGDGTPFYCPLCRDRARRTATANPWPTAAPKPEPAAPEFEQYEDDGDIPF